LLISLLLLVLIYSKGLAGSGNVLFVFPIPKSTLENIFKKFKSGKLYHGIPHQNRFFILAHSFKTSTSLKKEQATRVNGQNIMILRYLTIRKFRGTTPFWRKSCDLEQ